jgi:hypothetical protein
MPYTGVDVAMEAVRAFARMTSIPSLCLISRRFHQFLFLSEPGVTGLARVRIALAAGDRDDMVGLQQARQGRSPIADPTGSWGCHNELQAHAGPKIRRRRSANALREGRTGESTKRELSVVRRQLLVAENCAPRWPRRLGKSPLFTSDRMLEECCNRAK